MHGAQALLSCSAAYIVALLHDGFKLGMHERRLRFTNYVEDPQGNSMDVDWTLGMQCPAASISVVPGLIALQQCIDLPALLSIIQLLIRAMSAKHSR